MSKRWEIAEPISEDVKRQFPELDAVVLQLLWNRGVHTSEAIEVFLGPDWSRDTHDPSLFLQMPDAVNRVFSALEAGEMITVHGDYDADGTCGTAVLVTTLRDIARAFGWDDQAISSYIPHREKEGYGLAVATVDRLHTEFKTGLIITVDCGISNKEAIDHAKELGIDTIVCDHHTMPPELPESAILIHPLVPGETFPNKHLCGTGVAYKLASGLIHEAQNRGAEFPVGYEKWLLDLVAIATVTDVMPLHGENRVLEKYGLLVLNKSRRVGIQKLLDVAGAKKGELDTTSIGFQIGPRINAAGRMTHADEALALLIEEDEVQAAVLAQRLQELNRERQKASRAMYEQAKRMVGEAPEDPLIVVYQEGWGAGLVGLVAGKLLTEFGVPTFAVSQEGDKFVGSGRSVNGFDVTQALHHASKFLDKFGGHPQACGFSVTGEDKFMKAIALMKEYAREHVTQELLEPRMPVDISMPLDAITWELYDALQQFAPFGQGNRAPVFVSEQVKVRSFAAVGKTGGHLKLRVQSQTGKLVDAIGFNMGKRVEDLSLGGHIDVAYEIQVNEWNGNRSLQIRLIDLRI